MILARLSQPADFEGWRDEARRLVGQGAPPEAISWLVAGEEDLFSGDAGVEVAEMEAPAALRVPRAFPELAETVICHRDPERFGLLYRLLLRLQAEPSLLTVATDDDVHRAEAMARTVRRDMHKMTAFVRFREVREEGEEPVFVAWFEPEHFILKRVSSFFTGRFATMRWSILTPQGSLHWDGTSLRMGEGATRAQAPDDDAMEAYWRCYYANIFNPARLKTDAMRKEMPVRYWRNLPEAELIAPLIAGAARQAEEMVMRAPTLPPERHLRQQARMVPAPSTDLESFENWEQAAAAARDCKRCDLCRDATQTVFGEGPLDAPVIFVGEQPGDQEDLAGRPFVGPAGRLFDAALEEAGLARERAYVTNAVKHFKFSLRGKRRIHERPNAGEVQACRFWLGIERQFLKPQLVVALGATAVSSLMGRTMSLSSVRGRDVTLEDGAPMLATVHPSYLLRLPDEARRGEERERFVADLRRIGELVPELKRRRAA
ncbi:UdgX family uracil-DNA binding protein [Bosea sp. BH3]|uniref:UdgX family uracil-DNA binding protein n=1 Tax=Bosea sp. BH3 TaxID=2871701 RepID=UPI0021CB2BA7|nr:UdgX family uracil-DNA binding protein [Bosea sp. BH3]MCU4180658.1 UdgX family uracil-DNA binding protein [Bosea sp. BH3]